MEAAAKYLDQYMSGRPILEKINLSNFIVVSPNIIAFFVFILFYKKGSQNFDKVLRLMVNLSTGTLFADLVKNIIPETVGQLKELQERNEAAIQTFAFTLLATLMFLVAVDKISRLLNKKSKESKSNSSFIKVGTFLLADGIHNFMDGIAVATFYKMGHGLGITSTISMFIHEIPHQLGDFSLLILKGYSVLGVFVLQSFTSIFTLMGGMFAERIDEAYLLFLNAIVIVSFIHLIFTHIIPSIVKETDTVFMIVAELLFIYIGYIQIN
jgi:zinc transporter ZupT